MANETTTRTIITIDEEKCTGCGACVPGCPEGALQIIDGKARLVSDLFCDGLGACIGECPEGAITTEERVAEAYDEERVMRENIVPKGENTIRAHLAHLRDHGEEAYLALAKRVLHEKGIVLNDTAHGAACPNHAPAGCPGTRERTMPRTTNPAANTDSAVPSALTHWPVQLHLINPMSEQFRGCDLLLAADCTAFSVGGFHQKYLRGKALAIACPKLDSGLERYEEKIRMLIDRARINTLTVMTMEVPCCGGLFRLVTKALAESSRSIPVKHVVVSITGEIISGRPLKTSF